MENLADVVNMVYSVASFISEKLESIRKYSDQITTPKCYKKYFDVEAETPILWPPDAKS